MKSRLDYARMALKKYPQKQFHDCLIVTDECLFTLNNSSVRKEYRKKGTRPMQTKKTGFPQTVMCSGAKRCWGTGLGIASVACPATCDCEKKK
jgi:hypothetical protein